MAPSTEQCICQICNCGRHKCKLHPNRAATNGPCTFSEYTNKYIQHPIVPVQSFKPTAVASQSQGPLSDQTTNRIDYVPLPLERPSVHQPDQYKPPQGVIDNTTMYRKDFTEKRGDKTLPIRREMNRGVPGKFEGEPTYQHDYRKWDMPKLERRNTDLEYVPPKEAFGGIPTYTTDYVPYRSVPPASFKPQETAKNSGAPLEDMTDYRQSYVPHPLERKQQKERVNWNRPAVPFEGLSTFQRDYTPKPGALRESMKPNAQAFNSNAPFKDDTTNRIDYKPWELSKPWVRTQDAYRPPDGAMEGLTSYSKDFVPHPWAKQGYSKREDRGRPSGPFEGTTDYADNFRKWGMGPRVHAGPSTEYHPNPIPFEGSSTTATHFIPHPLDVRQSFKPSQTAARGDGAFDDNTLYRMEYTPKHLEPCPAALLGSQSSRYAYKATDPRGHEFYAPKNGNGNGRTTVTDLQTGRMVSVN